MIFHLLYYLIFTASVAADSLNISTSFRLNNVFKDNDTCYGETRLFSEYNSVPYEIFEKTNECVEEMRSLKELDTPDVESGSCSQGLLDVSVTPSYIAKSQISYPYANLNISATLHSSVSHIFIRLECLHAEDGSDVYCSNHPLMIINGRHEWPCRGIKIADTVSFPAKFGYSCFRLTPFSTYAINVTLWPQKCRTSLIVTTPSLYDLFPEENSRWAPMLILDLSDSDGIWVRVGKPSECLNYPGETIRANVYRQNSTSLTFLESLDIVCPKTGVKWSNVVRGSYLIVAYLVSKKCEFQCESSGSGCVECRRTNINFTIPEDRTSTSWRAARIVHDSSEGIFTFLIVICTVFVILAFFYTRHLKRARKMEDQEEIELNNRVKVLLIYANDCEEHNLCVSSFVDCLRFEANSDVLYDVEQLQEAGNIPSRWLIDSFCAAQKHLIILSPCGLRMLEDLNSEKKLVQDRPFPDVFGPGLDLIIRKCTLSPQEACEKFAIIRMAYSPQVPEMLKVLGLREFEIPAHFGEMTAFLHDLEDGEERFVVRQNLDRNLAENVARMEKMVSENSDWIEKRFVENEDICDNIDVGILKEEIETDEERRNIAGRLNLILPDSEEEGCGNELVPFVLYEPSDSDEN